MSQSVNQRSLEQIKAELKRLLVENLSLEHLKPQDISDDAELFGEDGVGLDSLDGVEVASGAASKFRGGREIDAEAA